MTTLGTLAVLVAQTLEEMEHEADQAFLRNWGIRIVAPFAIGIPLYYLGRFIQHRVGGRAEAREHARREARGERIEPVHRAEAVLAHARTLADIDVVRVVGVAKRRWCGGGTTMRPDVAAAVMAALHEVRAQGGYAASVVTDARTHARRRAEVARQPAWAVHLVGEAAAVAAAVPLLVGTRPAAELEVLAKPWAAAKGARYGGEPTRSRRLRFDGGLDD